MDVRRHGGRRYQNLKEFALAKAVFMFKTALT